MSYISTVFEQLTPKTVKYYGQCESGEYLSLLTTPSDLTVLDQYYIALEWLVKIDQSVQSTKEYGLRRESMQIAHLTQARLDVRNMDLHMILETAERETSKKQSV